MAFKSKFRSIMFATALAVPVAVLPVAEAHAGIGLFISVGIAPPVLPVYAQPVCPGDGFLWTPGYWAYGDAGYYWVPGVWVRPPQVGVLWTPAYWGWEGGQYRFHDGYWGPHIGFYGGINYGFGYGGVGYEGGYWGGGHFFYNRAVGNYEGVHITNVYNRTVIVNNRTNVSFNGGQGGIQARASAQEMAAVNEHHFERTGEQAQHQNFAAQDRGQLASVNHGRPSTPAAQNVGAYHQVAQQRPITPADRAAGKANPNGREANQDQRIANGEKSGQMTSGEAARADRTQSNIDSQVHNDRVANGGKLTGQEKQQVGREQNAASNQIYNEKHNGNTIAPNEVNNREANQQQRTANGLRSGQMTSGEAARTNARQAGADQTVHNQRTANGGALTTQQHAQANRQENRNSAQINNEKHNAAKAPAEREGKH
jgi:hypothetical protein